MSGNIIWEWSFGTTRFRTSTSRRQLRGAAKTISDNPGKITSTCRAPSRRTGWTAFPGLNRRSTRSWSTPARASSTSSTTATRFSRKTQAAIALAATTAAISLPLRRPSPLQPGNPPRSLQLEMRPAATNRSAAAATCSGSTPACPGPVTCWLFNNNQYLYQRRRQSYVFEINPYLASTGNRHGRLRQSAPPVTPPGRSTRTRTRPASSCPSRCWKYGSVSKPHAV